MRNREKKRIEMKQNKIETKNPEMMPGN